MKFLIALAIALICSPAFAADGNQPIKTGKDFLIPAGLNGLDVNRKWSAPKICKVSKSQTCTLCESGTADAPTEGILVELEVSSGAIGSFAVATDSGALPSDSPVVTGAPAASGVGSVIASQRTCEYTLATTGLSAGNCGVKNFAAPRPFTRGLVLCASKADVEVIATYYIQRK